MLSYSLNHEWRGQCPECCGVTLGENVIDTVRASVVANRIYAVCGTCGWEGQGAP